MSENKLKNGIGWGPTKMENFVRRVEEEIRGDDDKKEDRGRIADGLSADVQVQRKRKIAAPTCSPQKKKCVAESIAEKKEAAPTACSKCARRLRVTNNYSCRCGGIYCIQHRFHDQHDCTFDYKAMAIAKLAAQNPKIAGKRIGEI